MKIYKDKKGFYADPYLIRHNGVFYSTDGRGFMPNGIFSTLCESKDADYEKINNDFEVLELKDAPDELLETLEKCLNINFNNLYKIGGSK